MSHLSLFLQQCPVCLICLTWVVCKIGGQWPANIVALLWGVMPRIYSKQHNIAFFCNSHLAFSSCILLESRWCIHTVVLTQPQLGRNQILSNQRKHISIWFIDLSIAVHTFASQILILLSVDEILLLRYVNWSTNFRGLLPKMEMTSSSFKTNNSQDQTVQSGNYCYSSIRLTSIDERERKRERRKK